MTPRRRTIPQRTPLFLGCEGESEQAYGQVLNDLLRDAGRPVHLEVVNLNPGAGEPISRLRKAGQEIDRRQQRRSAFRLKVVLMDSDQVDADGKQRQHADQCAQECGIRIIWQEPCHEALLLRHLDGFAYNRPLTSGAAAATLKMAWPEYRKPMTKIQLARRIDLEAVRRAGAVEPALLAFLREIALLP